jgi:dihydrodipicolinate synthase/N-acetylneuraminate lyase
MDVAAARNRLTGLYVTIPTMFHDDAELSLDLEAIRRHVNWLIDGGCRTGSAAILAGGAAGDFMTMTFDERVTVAKTVVEAAAGRVPVVMGGQTTSTLELVRLARAAVSVGAEYLQISPPFYFANTEGDFYEYVLAAAQAAPDLGLIIYNTYWTSAGVSSDLVRRLAEIPSVISLKWAVPDSGNMDFEQIVLDHSGRFTIIDNQLRWVSSHILGARSIEAFEANYWPRWAIGIWQSLEAGRYAEVQREMMRVALPLHQLWAEIERYTSGNGYPVKLCLEVLGMGSSRDRPPTRDVRGLYLDKTREMLVKVGHPGVVAAQ